VRAAWTLALLPVAAAFAASQGNAQSDLADQQRRLVAARAQSAEAAQRAQQLDAAARTERDAKAKARAEEAALGARIQQAQADIAAASARVALVDRLLGDQQARLAVQQGPVARLVAALCSLAQRPDAVSVMQPGSVADLVHVRAVLGSTLPLVRARTAGLRADLDQTRKLRADAVLAARSLDEGRRRLETNRIALARMEAEHRLKSQDLTRSALAESDRAIGLGERARDLVDDMQVTTDAAATARTLTALPGGATSRPRRTAAGTGSPRATARAVSRAASTVRTWAAPTASNHTSPTVTASSSGNAMASSAVAAPRSPWRRLRASRLIRCRAGSARGRTASGAAGRRSRR